VAKAAGPVHDESTNFVLIGSVDTAKGTPALSRAYSKIAPWPDTEGTIFNTGCYESGINPAMPGCFRVVDVSDPYHPVRIATVEVYDTVQSPLPPVPTDNYWLSHSATNVWTNPKFDSLPFSTSCGDWAPGGPGWTTGPTCWDKGWVTRTHYTAGASGDFQEPDSGPGCGLSKTKKSSIYWVNSQRQNGAPAKRLGYTGIGFYDLKDPYNPQFLSRIDLDPGRMPDNTYWDHSGVHHGFFDGRYAYIGGGEVGFIGHHLIIIDAIDPRHPKIVGRWWIPGQKTPEEDAIRNDNTIITDPVTGVQTPKGWLPGAGFQPVTLDKATGLLKKDNSFHWIAVYDSVIKGKDIAFISWHSAGLVILDVTDKTKPKFISRFDYLTPAFQAADKLPGAQIDHDKCVEVTGSPNVACGYSHSGKIVPGTNSKYYWETDEYFTLPYGHLRMFDVSDLKHPKLLSHLMLPETTDSSITYAQRTASTHLGNAWDKNRLFLAYYGLGVKAINFSDPRHPYLDGTYSFTINDGKGGQAVYDVIFDPKGNLVVTDSVDGVRILRYTGPGSPLK
jgi:hypothetical protein